MFSISPHSYLVEEPIRILGFRPVKSISSTTLNLKDKVMQIKETIGIDVSKPFIDVFIYSSKNHKQFSNSSKGFNDLIRWLNKHSSVPKAKRIFAFEHTGLYSIPLSIFLSQKRLNYVILPGLELRRSLGIARGKNDKVDAKAIAFYAYRRREELQPYQLPSAKFFELRKLLSLREKLVKQKAGYMATNKEINNFLSKDSHPVYFEVHQEMLAIFKEKIRKVEKQITAIFKNDPLLFEQFKLITSITGVGTQTAWYIIVYTQAFTLFENSRKFASYAGIAPFPYQSGISIKGRTKVHHLANKKFKALLSSCATSAIIHNSELRLYYQKRLEKGKHKMSTINVVRNKILSRIFAVIERGTPYVNTLAYAA